MTECQHALRRGSRLGDRQLFERWTAGAGKDVEERSALRMYRHRVS